MTASKLPELILFAPQRRGPAVTENRPTLLRTPEGEELTVFGQELATQVGRRYILIASPRSVSFEEDEWVGGALSFGDTNEAAAIFITNRDERGSLVNVDPDSARSTAAVLNAIVRVRDHRAGVYGTAVRRGRLAVGQPIFYAGHRASGARVH